MSSIGDTVVSQSIQTTDEIHANKLIMSRYALTSGTATNKDGNREGQLFFNLLVSGTPDNGSDGFYLWEGSTMDHLNQAAQSGGGA